MSEEKVKIYPITDEQRTSGRWLSGMLVAEGILPRQLENEAAEYLTSLLARLGKAEIGGTP